MEQVVGCHLWYFFQLRAQSTLKYLLIVLFVDLILPYYCTFCAYKSVRIRCVLDIAKNYTWCLHGVRLYTAVETLYSHCCHLLVTFMKMFQCCNKVLVLCKTHSK